VTASAGEPPAGRTWLILAVASLGVFLGGAELMVVAIALPTIVADFGGWGDLARASWIVNAYLLAYVVAMPLAGRAADLWGARRLYLVALALFAAGSLAAALSRTLGLDALILARAVQGFGGGALVPLSLALAGHLFSGRPRATAFGVEGAATFVGMAVGPAYGAWVLLTFASPIGSGGLVAWQWIFILNVPVAAVAALLLHLAAGRLETPRAPGRLDLFGALLLSAALVLGVWAISDSGAAGWTDAGVIGALVAGGLLLGGFALRALRQPPGRALVELRLFATPDFAAANLVSLMTGYTLATAIIGGPVFVSQVLSGGPDRSAPALTALTVAIVAGALMGGFVSGRLGERVTASAGVALTVAGLALATGWGTDADLGRLQRDLAIFGLGFGLTVSPRATAALESAGASAYGMAGAMLQLTRTIGMSVGLALLTGIAQHRIDALNTILNDQAGRDAVMRTLGHPELVGVDPGASLALLALLGEWSRGEAAAVLRLVFVIALGVAAVTLLPAIFVGAGGRGPRGRVRTGAAR
jgi:EmrB/QacA subfamily drug resistance transporter